MSNPNEFSSFKLLLKNVYNAHVAKIRELENEIRTLKEKLTEKERLASTLVDCKRCAELEAAFKSCKKALHDQSKLFENFGQKFSIFNSPELGSQEVKSASKLANTESETARFSRSLKNNMNMYDKNKSCVISSEDDTVTESKINNADKISVVSNNQNLLKKLMCSDAIDSLDAYTVTFPDYVKHEDVNGISDSVIFAPDSLDVSLDAQKEHEAKSKKNNSICHTNKKISIFNGSENLRENEKNLSEMKVSGKRLSESISEDRPKRFNTGKNMEIDVKICDIQESKSVISDEVPKQFEVKTKNNLKDLNVHNGQVLKKKIISTENIESTDKNAILKNSVNIAAKDLKIKLNSHEISPSLLPTSKKVQSNVIHLDTSSNDNDDFQELAPISKIVQSEDSLDVCDKKKIIKKNKNNKPLKFSSKYKMTLDAPPLNFKKTNLKQTKLTKSLLKIKETNVNKESTSKHENDCDLEVFEDNSVPTVLQEGFHTSTQYDATKAPSAVDFDATFIPENFKFDSLHCATSSVKKNAVGKSDLKNGGLFSNISFPEELKSSVKSEIFSKNENVINDYSSPEDAEIKENMNSFDRLPVPEEPNFKYKNDVVRKKSERRQLNAFECNECEKYYSELGLTDKEKKERMKKCSRHRGKFTPPATPDHFWELEFPDTEECKARGYMNETQRVKLGNICNM